MLEELFGLTSRTENRCGSAAENLIDERNRDRFVEFVNRDWTVKPFCDTKGQ